MAGWHRMSDSSSKIEARLRRREAALAMRTTMSASRPAPDLFRVATWNVNSLKARASGLDRLLGRTAPDVLLIQEIKSGV
jgi:hypothetical protein